MAMVCDEVAPVDGSYCGALVPLVLLLLLLLLILISFVASAAILVGCDPWCYFDAVHVVHRPRTTEIWWKSMKVWPLDESHRENVENLGGSTENSSEPAVSLVVYYRRKWRKLPLNELKHITCQDFSPQIQRNWINRARKFGDFICSLYGQWPLAKIWAEWRTAPNNKYISLICVWPEGKRQTFGACMGHTNKCCVAMRTQCARLVRLMN